jgi:Flp pilus assembly secretin CpaC
MKKVVFLFGLLVCALSSASISYAQRRGSALAAVPVPGQPPTQAAPTPTPAPATPQPAGVPRPTTPATPGAKPEEQLRIVPDQATNSLIIYGTAQEFQNIKNILKDLDIIPRQVLMDVLVAEVTLTDNLSFGIEYEIFNRVNPTIFGQTFGSQGALRTGILPAPSTTTSGGTSTTATLTQFANGLSGIIGRNHGINAFITALATDSRVKVLSSPTVLATDNRPARIQVGSEIPVLSSQQVTATTTGVLVNNVQYRNTGVILTIIPQVNSQGLVHLQVKQEVSDVGIASFGGTGSPSFSTRDAETTAVVQDGETLAIGGIISERKSRDRKGIPYLMDLPVVGRFFATTTDSTDRTELIMLITPHVVRNRDESRDVTEEFRSKLSDLRNELERLNRERAKQKAKQLPPPEPVRPENKPSVPAPTSAVPVPETPRPAPARAPAVSAPSMAPANSPSLPQQQVLSVTPPISNASVDPTYDAQSEVETGSAAQTALLPREADTQAAETDTVGVLLNAIEADKAAATITSAAKPRPAKPAQVWFVQVASFAKERDAQVLANKLRDRGYDANVVIVEVAGKTWNRVEVGHLASRNEARELQKNLQVTEKIEQSIVASR